MATTNRQVATPKTKVATTNESCGNSELSLCFSGLASGNSERSSGFSESPSGNSERASGNSKRGSGNFLGVLGIFGSGAGDRRSPLRNVYSVNISWTRGQAPMFTGCCGVHLHTLNLLFRQLIYLRHLLDGEVEDVDDLFECVYVFAC